MLVKDDEVATLRAYLLGNVALFHEIRGQRDRSRSNVPWAAFMTAAFVEAVNRRFGKGASEADVIGYVADVRSRSEEVGEIINPRAAKRLILAVTDDEDTDDIDAKTMGEIFIVFVGALVSDSQLDDHAVDAFLADTRKLADRWLAA